MIPNTLAKWFGCNWKTSTVGFLTGVAFFITQFPTYFHALPLLIDICKFLTGSGIIALGKLSKDAHQQGDPGKA